MKHPHPTSDRRSTQSPIAGAKVLETAPPHNPDVEQAVLGGILLAAHTPRDEDLLAEAFSALEERHFYASAHRTVYAAMRELYTSGRSPDLVSVTDRLRQKGALTELQARGYDPDGPAFSPVLLSGAMFVTGLLNLVFSATLLPHHISLLRQYAARRALVHLALELAEDAATADLDTLQHAVTNVAEVVSRARR